MFGYFRLLVRGPFLSPKSSVMNENIGDLQITNVLNQSRKWLFGQVHSVHQGCSFANWALSAEHAMQTMLNITSVMEIMMACKSEGALVHWFQAD